MLTARSSIQKRTSTPVRPPRCSASGKQEFALPLPAHDHHASRSRCCAISTSPGPRRVSTERPCQKGFPVTHPSPERVPAQEDGPSWYFLGLPLGLDVFPGISGAGTT